MPVCFVHQMPAGTRAQPRDTLVASPRHLWHSQVHGEYVEARLLSADEPHQLRGVLAVRSRFVQRWFPPDVSFAR